jgi:hypothetical protein
LNIHETCKRHKFNTVSNRCVTLVHVHTTQVEISLPQRMLTRQRDRQCDRYRAPFGALIISGLEFDFGSNVSTDHLQSGQEKAKLYFDLGSEVVLCMCLAPLDSLVCSNLHVQSTQK